MSFFKHNKDQGSGTATAPPPPHTTDMLVVAPMSGKISLAKGSGVNLDKRGAIVASNGWTAQGKDYDLKALVRYHDGRTVYVGAANTDEVLRTWEGAVSHSGDVKSPGQLERITINWDPAIASVALSSYSALENGMGSFRQYGVYVDIANGDQVVGIAAANSSADPASYTCFFGEVIFNPDGSFTVYNREEYSRSGSENRIGYDGDRVVMDIGPRGRTK